MFSPESNEDWERNVWIVPGLSVRESPDNTTYLLFFLGSFVVRFSLLMSSFQSVFWSSLYFLLKLLFARYSPFIYSFSCSLSRSSRRILPILAFLRTFLSVFLDSLHAFTSCFLRSLCLFLSSLYSLKTLSPRTLITTISSGWQSYSFIGNVALQVD